MFPEGVVEVTIGALLAGYLTYARNQLATRSCKGSGQDTPSARPYVRAEDGERRCPANPEELQYSCRNDAISVVLSIIHKINVLG